MDERCELFVNVIKGNLEWSGQRWLLSARLRIQSCFNLVLEFDVFKEIKARLALGILRVVGASLRDAAKVAIFYAQPHAGTGSQQESRNHGAKSVLAVIMVLGLHISLHKSSGVRTNVRPCLFLGSIQPQAFRLE